MVPCNYTRSDLWITGTHNMHLKFLVEMGLFEDKDFLHRSRTFSFKI